MTKTEQQRPELGTQGDGDSVSENYTEPFLHLIAES